MSKRYSNKGLAARRAAESAALAQQEQKKTNMIVTLITVGLALAVVIAMVLAIVAGTGGFAKKVNMDEIRDKEINKFLATDFAETEDVTEYVKITVKDYGDIVIRLRPDIAPKTVSNFQNLVKDGHYEGKIFHRIIQGFMIQGGGFCEKDACYVNNGAEHKVASIEGEFTSNGYYNNLKHIRGVISMARTNDKNSASNQFFICDATASDLDGGYASFGYVLAGMEVVDQIAAVKTGSNDRPTSIIMIEKVTFVDPLK